jgi:hypothetical protein
MPLGLAESRSRTTPHDCNDGAGDRVARANGPDPKSCERILPDEGLFPSRPDLPCGYPEEPIDEAEARAWMSALQHNQLLQEHDILQHQIPAPTEKANKGSDPKKKEAKHGEQLYQIDDRMHWCKPLILQAARVLATDTLPTELQANC